MIGGVARFYDRWRS